MPFVYCVTLFNDQFVVESKALGRWLEGDVGEMAAAGAGDGQAEEGGVHVIEISNGDASTDEISPLLADAGSKPAAPRMTIFSVSYPARKAQVKSLETSQKAAEAELDIFNHVILWAWNGSRYSGLLCMAASSIIYYIMEVMMDIFPVRTIPLFETIFTRCTVIFILSLVWLRRTGQPFIFPTQIRNLMVIRSLTGFISLMCFVYSVQNLPLSYAVLLNFATPIMASIGARIILQEKAGLLDAAGLACSFFGLLFIYQPAIIVRGNSIVTVETSNKMEVGANHSIYPLLFGIISSILGGISYCLIRAGATASDQPVYMVFSFGALASLISAICTFTLQEFVLPNFFTILLMIILGVLAFLAEISLARGLQLVKISKIMNLLFIKEFLSQIGGMTFLGLVPSFSKLVGCLLIVASVFCTIYFGPEKEIE